MDRFFVVSNGKEIEVEADSFAVTTEGVLIFCVETAKENTPSREKRVAAFPADWWSSVQLVTK